MNITDPIIVNDPPVPREKSAGGINSYCVICPYTQRSTSYCVCLHTLKAMEENRLSKEQFSDCQRAVAHDGCKAKYMRRMEEEAGHALFFRERTNTIAADQPAAPVRAPIQPSAEVMASLERRYPSLRGKQPVAKHTQRRVNSTAAASESVPVGADMAQVVNTILAEETAPRKGESVLEWMRRKNASKNGA